MSYRMYSDYKYDTVLYSTSHKHNLTSGCTVPRVHNNRLYYGCTRKNGMPRLHIVTKNPYIHSNTCTILYVET